MADPSPVATQTSSPSAPPAASTHPWTEVVERLQEAAPYLDQHDPDLRKRIEKLAAEVEDHPRFTPRQLDQDPGSLHRRGHRSPYRKRDGDDAGDCAKRSTDSQFPRPDCVTET